MSKILAYMRKWAFDGETPQKERKGNGRLAWPFRFKLHPVTLNRCLADDIELVSKEEIDRLTRELAEAKARAVIPDGWVAVPVEPTAEMRDTFCADPGSATYFSHTTIRCEDFGSRYRAMLSARPEFPAASCYNFPSVDDLAQAIRRIDGNNSLGAGELAETIIEYFVSGESENE